MVSVTDSNSDLDAFEAHEAFEAFEASEEIEALKVIKAFKGEYLVAKMNPCLVFFLLDHS